MPRSFTEFCFSNPANAYILLNLILDRLYFVYEVSECKHGLEYDTRRLLVFTKVRRDPQAEPP